MTNKAMRLDPESISSNGTQHHANGSTTISLKNGVASTNGHTSPTNGILPQHQKGYSTSAVKRGPNFFGYDREEVTRLLIQGLGDLGYHSAANRLSQESGFEVESPAVSAFRDAILQGQWSEAESLLFGVDSEADGGGVSISNGDWQHIGGLKFAEGADPDRMRFKIREQKYLELLEKEDTGRAMMVLRHELQPLHHDRARLDVLSGLIVCPTAEDLRSDAQWDGAAGNSRQNLLQDLSRSISPSVMIPEHRLGTLLGQIKQSQISKCLYHNPSSAPSLFTDHMCDRTQFPLQTIVELSQSEGEVWFVEFSHNGKRLAASGEDSTVVIYDTNTFQVRHTLREHTSGVVLVAWSPDDSKLITCSKDQTAKVWDMETGKRVVEIKHHEKSVTVACWTHDGQSFVTGSHDLESQLCLWTLDGRPSYNWTIDYRVQDCAITPNGRRMVVISVEQQISVYDFWTREEEYSIMMKHKMTSVSISRDSNYMLINMANDEVHLIEIETAEIYRRFLGQKQDMFIIRSCFGGADENLIISGSAGSLPSSTLSGAMLTIDPDSKVYIWHKENGTLIETLEGHSTGCVNTVAWNPANPCMFASGGDDSKVRIWSKEPEPSNARRRRFSSHSSTHRGHNGRITYEP